MVIVFFVFCFLIKLSINLGILSSPNISSEIETFSDFKAKLLWDDAPETCEAILKILPLTGLQNFGTLSKGRVNLAYGESAAAVEALEYYYGENILNNIFNERILILSGIIFLPSKNELFLSSDFIFKASRTLSVAKGIIGFNKIEIFAICSRAVCKILFIFSTLFFFSFHGSSSLMYLFVKKLIFITDFM